jgi:hypothetical protein
MIRAAVFRGVTIFASVLMFLPMTGWSDDVTIVLPDSADCFVIEQGGQVQFTSCGNGKVGIRKADPATALDVDGTVTALQFIGDGSQLANVKSVAASSQGDSYFTLVGEASSGGSFDVVKSVSITVPGPGIILASATSSAAFEGVQEDYARIALLSSWEGDPNSTPGARSAFFDHLVIVSDRNSTDYSAQYTSLNALRAFTVNGAGTYTIRLWGDSYLHDYDLSWRHNISYHNYQAANKKTSLFDTVVAAMYFPTGSVAVANPLEQKHADEVAPPAGERRNRPAGLIRD